MSKCHLASPLIFRSKVAKKGTFVLEGLPTIGTTSCQNNMHHQLLKTTLTWINENPLTTYIYIIYRYIDVYRGFWEFVFLRVLLEFFFAFETMIVVKAAQAMSMVTRAVLIDDSSFLGNLTDFFWELIQMGWADAYTWIIGSPRGGGDSPNLP